MVSRNLGLLSTLVLVRLLSPGDFGLVALANGLISMVDALTSIGVYDALVRARDPNRATYDTCFTVNALRNIATAIVIVIVAEPVAILFNDHRLTIVMLALSVRSLLSAGLNVRVVDFRRDLDFRKEFNLNTWCRVVGIIATVSCALIWPSYWALIIGLISMHIVQLPLSYWMVPYLPRFSLAAWRSIFSFSMWTWAQTLLLQARDRTDAFVISRFVGTKPFGTYSVGLELGTLPATELMEPLSRALFSGFATLHNAAAGTGKMFIDVFGVSVMLVLPAGFGISMVADPMVRIMLGDQWTAAIIVVQVIALSSISSTFVQPAGALVNAIGRPHAAFYVGIVSAIVKLVTMLLLVPAIGLFGASLSLAICSAVELILFAAVVLPRVGVTVGALLRQMIRPVIGAGAMIAVLWSLHMAWTPADANTYLGICIDAAQRSLVGATVYVSVVGLLWLAAGRPSGPEQFLLSTGMQMLRRFSVVLPTMLRRIGISRRAGA
jgi:O-antigen/teichoic acid export membrane protein